MQTQDTVRIPLRAIDGSIRAYTVVDVADAEWVNQWTWRLSAKGYAVRSTKRAGCKFQTFRLNRELLGLVEGDGLEGDHIDRDKLNNQRSNLRPIPKRAQQQNLPSRGASPFRGVYYRKDTGKWAARVKVAGKMTILGCFATETEAAEAARDARARLMPYAID